MHSPTPRYTTRRRQRYIYVIAGSVLLLLCLAVANLAFGSTSLPFADVVAAMFGNAEEGSFAEIIVIESRLPQMLTAILAGASLATAGLLMQTVFANPLADPSILGVGTGAGLGVAIAMLLMGGSAAGIGFALSGFLFSAAAAFIGAMVVIGCLIALQRFMPGRLMLLVAGVMLSFVGSSFISLINFWATAQGVQSYFMWGLGNFGTLSLSQIPMVAVLTLIAMTAAWLLTKPLNALLLGDDYAMGLGINVRRIHSIVLLVTGLLVAVTTAVCGPITFIGLAVPHLARHLAKSATHDRLFPLTMIWGANVALACNILAHLPGDRGLLPINTLTPLVGVPVVFYLLVRQRNQQ